MTEKSSKGGECMTTGLLENKPQNRATKRSQIPVPEARVPLKDVQQTCEKRSAVKKVPDFKQLHKQWEKKMQKAKETNRSVQHHTPIRTTVKMAQPHTVKPCALKKSLQSKREQPMYKTTDRIDVILARMALSTTQAIRKLSKTDQEDCSPLKVNLEDQFSAVDSPPKLHVEPVMCTKHVTLLPPRYINYYESEPELVDLVYVKSCPRDLSPQSGRRNPVGHTFNNVDCYFIPITSH